LVVTNRAAFGLTILVLAACTRMQPAPVPQSLALGRPPENVAAAAMRPPAIDRRYIAVAALGMQPLAKRTIVSVKDSGARGDGATDDTVAIRRAFNRIASGDVLLFPKGIYVYSDILVLHQSDVVIEGRDATLESASPKNESIVIAGDKSALVNMAIVGTGKTRLTTPESTDIEVTGRYNQIVGNRIDGGSSAGIFMYGARDYRVTGNSVVNTLADGIHSTHGSRRGLIEGNGVIRSGDDTIAVVSYTGEFPSGNILINDNVVGGNRWGRGITCVGCTDVVIANNAIAGVGCAAGVLVANEVETTGVDGVLVENNSIDRIEKTACQGARTGQAGIDINGFGTYPIRYVSLEGNHVGDTAFDGVRVLDTGKSGVAFDHINLNGNSIENAGGLPVEFLADPGVPSLTTCWDNTYDGKAYRVSASACTETAVTSAAWTQFNFVTPEGTTWAPDGSLLVGGRR
jgi:hypothetical protein